MQTANFLGNMTEAEIIASGQYQNRNGRYQRANSRFSRYPHNNHGRYEQRDNAYERGGKYAKYDRQEKSGRFEKTDRPRYDKFEKYDKTDRKSRYYQPKRPQNHAYSTIENSADYESVQLPRINLLELDQEKLTQTVRETVTALVRPIVGEITALEVNVEENRVLVKVESEDSGLLIGREGQHWAAVQ